MGLKAAEIVLKGKMLVKLAGVGEMTSPETLVTSGLDSCVCLSVCQGECLYISYLFLSCLFRGMSVYLCLFLSVCLSLCLSNYLFFRFSSLALYLVFYHPFSVPPPTGPDIPSLLICISFLLPSSLFHIYLLFLQPHSTSVPSLTLFASDVPTSHCKRQ